jgi:Bacterial regulatory helix-turn-helix protein, lysR family
MGGARAGTAPSGPKRKRSTRRTRLRNRLPDDANPKVDRYAHTRRRPDTGGLARSGQPTKRRHEIDRLTVMKTLVAVDKMKSFNGGARSLGISGSLVSRYIAYLEREVGVRLVNRTARSVTLTGEREGAGN